jgi:hypothetical protein
MSLEQTEIRMTCEIERFRLRRTIGTLIPPTHNPLVTVITPTTMIERITGCIPLRWTRSRSRATAADSTPSACIDSFVGRGL